MTSKDKTLARVCSGTAEFVLRSLAWLGGEAGSTAAERLVRHLPSSWLPSTRRVVRRNGIVYVLDLGDNTERTLFYTGFYDRALHQFLLAETRSGDTVIDVGAHIGLYALPIARKLQNVGGGMVTAFEPASDAAAMLRHLATKNRLQNVTVVPIALGATAERRPFRASVQYGKADAATRTLYGDGSPAGVVDVGLFDDWIEEHPLARIDVVKIDVEGGELDVLRGMRRSIARLAPRCIVVEVRATLLAQAGVTPDDLEALVAELGYCPDGPGIADVAAGRRGHLGANVVLRPCGEVGRVANRNRSPISYVMALRAISSIRSLRNRILGIGSWD